MKTGLTLKNAVSNLMQLLILMALPALLLLLHHYSRRTPVDDLQRWFGLNYLYMAMPHFLILFFAWPASRSLSFTLKGLLGINLLLGLFSAWVWLCAPPRESGLAWVIYIPVWCLYLAGMIAIYYWQKKKAA